MRHSTNTTNYVYVNLERPEREKVTGHDRPQGITGIATFGMKVTSEYLFVGDGRQDYSDQYQESYQRFFRSKGQLIVPGSTLKGAVRCVAEAISASCVSVLSWNDRRILNRYPICRVPRGTENIRICPACQIFGTTGYKGHISFSDALPDESIESKIIKIAELWGPRRLIPKRKFYKSGQYTELEDQSPEENYRYIEAVPKDSIFVFDLFFENAQESDLSLIFHSMGINQNFEIKVGGAKPRCLGNVSFEARRVRVIEQLILSKEKDPEDFMDKILRNEHLIKSERLKELTKNVSSKLECTGGQNQWI